jgi:hypothetical protein
MLLKKRFRDPNKKTRNLLMSSNKTASLIEKNWHDAFSVMGSKNNTLMHRNYREYFDKPVPYDVNGIR